MHLIIQGPIFSNGRNYKGEFVNYNAFECVISNIRNYKKFFNGQIVLSTYKGHLTNEQVVILEQLDIILLIIEDNLDGGYTIGIGKHKSHKSNTMKQYYTTFQGLAVLEGKVNNYDKVLKIRTDLEIDFNELHRSSFIINDEKEIFIEYITYKYGLLNPHFPDFTLLANYSSLRKLFHELLNKKFSSFVHVDLAAGITWLISGKRISYIKLEQLQSKSILFNKIFLALYYVTKCYNSIILSIYLSKIGIMDKSFTNTFKWRGSNKPLDS
jgi:hypothetical protein